MVFRCWPDEYQAASPQMFDNVTASRAINCRSGESIVQIKFYTASFANVSCKMHSRNFP
jgi:hypothetical protein